MWTEEDKIKAEEEVENAINYFTHEVRSLDKDCRWRRKAKSAVNFLREEFPESYILSADLSVLN